MRPNFLIYCAVTLLIATAAFFAGKFWAKQEAEQIAHLVIASETARQQATTFKFSRNALKQLKEQNPGEAELLITRLAKLQALALVECSKSEQCKRSAGSQMPSESELSEITATSWNK
jgi:hypothetical protein